jgi:hypothetical protein
VCGKVNVAVIEHPPMTVELIMQPAPTAVTVTVSDPTRNGAFTANGIMTRPSCNRAVEFESVKVCEPVPLGIV